MNEQGEWLNICILESRVFNLVTKQKYWQKPTYATLRGALVDMRNQAVDMEVKKIAMPRIGCGLDKLNWEKVMKIINDVFVDTDIDIVIRYF